MEYKNRVYRESFSGRWSSFVVKYKKTDVWIGIDKGSYKPDMPEKCEQIIKDLWTEMETYMQRDPHYVTALVPYSAKDDAPEIMRMMSETSRKVGIGPMSAVAGATSLFIAIRLKQLYDIKEIVIENGGDIYADIKEDMDVSVFAGASPLSEKVGLHVHAADSPMGICTSSGTVGPSISFGKADAVMVICRDVLLADSYATHFANFVHKADDIAKVLKKIEVIPEVLAALLVKEDKMGIVGKFEMKIFQKEND
ncbi:MAG: UPF0280 family protein [Culturomica sp.]|jgi:ApbE superfamily uncharacterized protein (UPF0280 family)|nr:UPF0280 family protein [Culturomica sp.]